MVRLKPYKTYEQLGHPSARPAYTTDQLLPATAFFASKDGQALRRSSFMADKQRALREHEESERLRRVMREAAQGGADAIAARVLAARPP